MHVSWAAMSIKLGTLHKDFSATGASNLLLVVVVVAPRCFSWALVFSIILSHSIQADTNTELRAQGFRPSVVSDTYLSEVRFAEVDGLNLFDVSVVAVFPKKNVSGKQPKGRDIFHVQCQTGAIFFFLSCLLGQKKTIYPIHFAVCRTERSKGLHNSKLYKSKLAVATSCV